MSKSINQFKVTIVKGPLAQKEKLQSTAWAFMADIVKNELDKGEVGQFRKTRSN
ncbi:hypothetical protein [Bacillus sp. Marseille-Q3570]|uniref:hypothetical protein n=1 Tax=Bacillus sp. Marseille-Q3570 TaxID=2963522 RepID=UPI0021B83F5B|nr:hypothetical protein [Bacillus sp. Marseille-Q3570]